MGEVVDEINPKWRKKDSLVKKSLKIAEKMIGEDFIDNKGNVVDSFKEKFEKLFSK